MNLEDLNITWISLGKLVLVEYEVLKEDRTYTAEDDDVPHPDFQKTLDAFNPDFAESFEKVEEALFRTTNITIDSDDSGFHIILKGKMTTKYNESVSVTSGKIPIPGNRSDLVEKVAEIRKEAFKYLFEGKCAQGKIDFEKKE